MSFGPEIKLETERLILRPMTPDDVEPHCQMMADERVARFLTLEREPQSKAVAWRAFASMLGHAEIHGFGFFSVFEKPSGDWVGRVGPWMPEGWPSLEVGWGVSPAHWGKGYAPEAAIAAINWVFDVQPALERVISLIDPENSNSQAVARKIGEENTGEQFLLEGFPLDIWVVSREKWRLQAMG